MASACPMMKKQLSEHPCFGGYLTLSPEIYRPSSVSLFGLLSGLTGIGGGIFLSPPS